MKLWALGAAAAVMALAACGSSSSTGGTTGTGGHTTTTHATVSSSSSSSSGTTGTGGSTTGDPCASGSDCTQCADFQTCYTCNQTLHPSGEMLFNTFINCEVCTACYTVCEGAQQGCMMAPATTDACDTGTPSTPGAGTACGNSMGGCIKCAQGGTCMNDLNACKNSMDCIAFNQALQACPTN